MRSRGGCMFIVTGLVIGLAVGLLVSLLLFPVKYANITPDLLGKTQKEAYRALIATSYNSRGDLGRAKARLNLLKDKDIIRNLTEQAQQTIAQAGPAQEARGLALLAAALNQQIDGLPTIPPTEPVAITPLITDTPELTDVTETPESADGTVEPIATEEVIFPTLEPHVEPAEPYILKDRKLVCDIETSGLLQVYVINKAGKSIPGEEVIVTWADGEDHFFTGLKPAIDPGYADFEMAPDGIYNLRLVNGSEMSTKISAPNCKTDAGMEYKGSVKLIFGQ